MARSRALITALVALTCAAAAAGSCEGGACPKQAAAARAAGLLGSTAASNGCTPKQYPETGALGVVSAWAGAAAAAACRLLARLTQAVASSRGWHATPCGAGHHPLTRE